MARASSWGNVIGDSESSTSARERHPGGSPSWPPMTNTTSRASASIREMNATNSAEVHSLPSGSSNTLIAEGCLCHGSKRSGWISRVSHDAYRDVRFRNSAEIELAEGSLGLPMKYKKSFNAKLCRTE